ncbi:MAG: alpha/beta hydrolase [Granulosicoccaceae bacterium]
MKKPDKESSSELDARRYYLSRMALAWGTLSLSSTPAAQQTDDSPLDFGFIKHPPGELYSLGRHRLHSLCVGDGDVTVLFEPGLGGSALEWLPIAESISSKVRACVYDRAGYAWSDPGSNPRHVVLLAREAKQLLRELKTDKNLILVGHSYGGLIMRQLASIMPGSVIGLILVDASHEDQFTRLAGESRVSMLPTSNNFVVSAPELPAGLRNDIKRKILALSRTRKTYAALHAEIESFRDSCDYLKNHRETFDFPVQIISRGLDPYANDDSAGNKNKIWHELQSEFLSLSAKAEQIIADNSGHHVHVDRPELIEAAIEKILMMHGDVK